MPSPRFARICDDVLQEWKAARRRLLKSAANRGAVHELRIQTRRLLALEMLLAPQGRLRGSGSLDELLHDAFRAMGRLRDAQLGAVDMAMLTPGIPEADRLARDLRDRQPQLARRLHRELRSLHASQLANIVAAWLEPARGDVEHVLPQRATRRLGAAANRLAIEGRNNTSTAARSLHRRRIRLKALRYMTEFAMAARCPVPRSLSLPRLAATLRALGAVTDLDAEARSIARFAAKHPAWRSTAKQLLRELHRRRTAALARIGNGTYSVARAAGA